MSESCDFNSNITIREWQCKMPQPLGCVSHDGHLYVNLVDGNLIDPALGAGNGTYAGAFDICGLMNYIASNSSQAVIVDNGDGTFTSTDADGNMVTWGDTNTTYTFVTNPDGTVTVTGSDGAVTTVGSPNTVAVDNGDGTGTVTNADGSIVNIITSVVTNTFSQDADGNIVVTPSDGYTPTVLPIDHPDDTDTLFGEPVIELDADGNPTGIITWPVVNADGTTTGDTVVQNMAGFISDDLPAPTIAVNNGDGTGSITNPDGTVVPFCAECPVPNTHELDDDGNLVITSGDGTSTTYVINNDTLLGPYTDSDGDGVYEAEVLSPDGTPTGDTVTSDFSALISSPHPDPVVDTDTWNEVTLNSDGSITYQLTNADGPVAGSDPVVIAAPCECLELTSHQYTRADTLAEIATGKGKASDFGGQDFLGTNQAVEPASKGRRNPDGKLGYASTVLPAATNDPLDYNGGTFFVLSDQTFNLEKGRYKGQIVHLTCSSGSGDLQATLTTSANFFWGIARDKDNGAISKVFGPTDPEIIVRYQEFYTFVWAGTYWLIQNFNHKLRYGSNWRENEDGTVTLWGNAPLNPAAFPAFTVFPTHVVVGTNGQFVAEGGQY